MRAFCQGGSATKIFLESVFVSAVSGIDGDRSVLAGLRAHENAFRELYLPGNADVLARLVSAAGRSDHRKTPFLITL